MKPILANAIAFLGLLMATSSALAQTWTQTSAPSNDWHCVASSADGTILIAGEDSYWDAQPSPGQIYLSADSGTTWTPADIPSNYWQTVASSADGTKLFAVPQTVADTIFISTNSGMTWISNYVSNVWFSSIVSSSDGKKLAGIDFDPSNNSWIYVSTNSGFTWLKTSAPEAVWTTTWQCIACSADGSKIFAGMWNPGGLYGNTGGPIYVSTNSGETWTQTGAPLNNWISIASSADGTKLVAVVNYGNVIYTSTNSGASWTQNFISSPELWTRVASSVDGTKLVAVSDTGKTNGIYTSTDSGATWRADGVPADKWFSAASSSDGTKLIAGNTYGIWTSQSIPSPQLNVALSSSNLDFSWIISSTNFVLQQCSDLSADNWMAVTNLPVLNLTNLQEQLRLAPTNNVGFFRLIAQ